MRGTQIGSLISSLALILMICLSSNGQHQLSKENPNDEILTMSAGKVFEREIVPMQKHRYAVKLEAGQYVKIDVEETQVDAVMSLRAPDGINLLDYAVVNAVDGVKSIWAAVSLDGIYELRVISYGEIAGGGTYRVRIRELRPATTEELSFTAGMKLYNETFNGLNPYLLTANAVNTRIANARKALQNFHDAGAVLNEARTLWQMGVVSSRLGVGPQTIEFYKASLEKFRSINDLPGQANALRDLGDAYEKIRDWDQAFRHLSESLKIAREIKRDLTEADVLNRFGEAYSRFRDFERAAVYFQQASVIYSRYSNITRSKPLNNLGKVSLESGEAAKAEGLFRQAVESVRKENYRFGATKTQESGYLNNMARAQYAQDKRDKAIETLMESMSVSREAGNNVSHAEALKLLGRIHLENGETNQALEQLGKALEVFRSIEDTQNAAESLLLVSKADAAKNDLETAQHHAEEAIGLIEQARAGVRNSDLRDSFSADLQDFYAFYVDLLMRRHKQEPKKTFAARALEANERGRARGLMNLLAESNADIREGVDANLLQGEKGLKILLSARLENLTRALNGKSKPEEIDRLKVEIEEIRTAYEQTQVRIRQASPHYSALTQPQTLDLAEIQATVLDGDSVLLEYALGEARSYLWIVTRDDVHSVELPAKAVIERAATLFYDSLTARNKDIRFETTEERDARILQADQALQNYSKDLSRMILGPTAPFLSNKRLLIVADGALQYVPFAALEIPDGKPEISNSAARAGAWNLDAGTAFLIESNEIVHLPSASVLSVIRKETANRKLPAKTLAVLADPVFDSRDERFQEFAGKTRVRNSVEFIPVSKKETRDAGDFLRRDSLELSRLPYTRREAELISSMVPAKQQQKLLDFAASRSSAMSGELSNYRFVHFATHGFINNENPELSGIVLSMFDETGAQRDGFLRIGDIYNLKLPADMVVLSGCKTGLGKEIRGEGLVGMTRGFIYAGAKRVTVSLWDVNDKATAELMGRYYREMLGERHLQPAAALRQAQIAMIREKRWQNPYFWAAFVLSGEPK